MKISDVSQVVIFVMALIIVVPLLGSFMAKVFAGERTWLSPVLGWLEKLCYRIAGVDEKSEMSWKDYTVALLLFNVLGILSVFLLQLLQGALPLNPQNLAAPVWHSAINTAVSFVTNTNWQGYSPENTMSYLTQMLGLAVQNFMSAATGMAVFLALARGLTRKSAHTLGNFWVDLTRTTVYVLLPFSFVLALILVSQGVVQTFSNYFEALTLEGAKQLIPLGPAASQVAIKMLGTNGGGFFNANAAHPFENPTPFANWIQMLAMVAIPAALTFTFGRMVKSQRQGWTLFAVMFSVWFLGFLGSYYAEMIHNPIFNQAGILEGKELRFGVVNSLIFSTLTTVISCGAVNAMHSSLSAAAGGVALFNMMMGEVIFGGVGAGMYGMLLFVLLTVFLSGLMVGRSPEYLGKKIEASEMKMAILGILAPCGTILILTSISVVLPTALSSLANQGPHGLSEILYAMTSSVANNGSAFAGLNANTVYYNLVTGVAMLIGRFIVIVPAMAIAGLLVSKKVSAPSAGTFRTDSTIFGLLLVGVIVIVGALTFLPALSLGPIVEHFLMIQGQTF